MSERFLELRRSVERRAAEKVFDAQVRMVMRENTHAVRPEEIREGDLVFVSAEVLPDPREAHLPLKLRSRFTGPFQVVAVGLGSGARNVQVRLPRPPFRK